ncbi:UDP-glucose 4-epimerase GalE [Candidatus Gottesmanbacteria bacterium RIFOXYB1_FULL_47_11]|uniref:UDP-glucose 4-epimerase n=1 Tax=Candidatus Gottesmanbacteria bacterium RIFOXYB1_FULL_47_11 TaxID=1798401 RepID=A0A1F6BD96_9BACT|nr:MAG: UDP-glucose 4-epimerase GalE [Candidatus Gottesmanbacteria bacterium RIFOXYB1_FULL_47_11]
MNILITGGAGYIGSNMVRLLVARGYNPVVLDSLEYGHRQAIPESVPLVVGNIKDQAIVESIFAKYQIQAVIHFAGYLLVEESVHDPIKYMKNNVIYPVTLLNGMRDHKVDKIIFSSSAAVYGNPQKLPIPEDHPKNPTSPYGLSKWCFEELLRVFHHDTGVRSISLRYFNACGAALDGKNGEDHTPETHIIPAAIRTAQGKQKEFFLYGTDYPTRDGSCLRDYIHIEDLAEAHLSALDALAAGHKTDVYNVATGEGTTNREIIDAIKKETGINFPVREQGRRAGDPHSLVADATRIKKEFGWQPKYSDIQTIVASAWKWHKLHPNGYGH